MKAIIVIESPAHISNQERAYMREGWRKFAEGGFTEPLFLSGATAKVLYVPDNFTGSNCFTPEEAQAIIGQIKAAAVVIGDIDK